MRLAVQGSAIGGLAAVNLIRPIGVIAAKDLVQRLRDRSVYIMGVSTSVPIWLMWRDSAV